MFDMRRLLPTLLLALVLSSCAAPGLIQNSAMKRGFNVMQHASMSWEHPYARQSLMDMRSTGANAVVLIGFLKQSRPDSVDVSRSSAVRDSELKRAIAYAHELGLYTILKPQMLVPGSWAGEIDPGSEDGWKQWFDAYSREIVRYARFAAAEHVDALVLGTELVHASKHVNWPALIRQVRQVYPYPGKITYAAHNVDGLKAFPYWNLLDTVSLTFYPSLGVTGQRDEMQQYVDRAVTELQQATGSLNKPLWVLEFGMPSAKGASARPWEWRDLHNARVDMTVQKEAIDIWLRALDKPWVDGAFIWVWYSDAKSGTLNDADYTPQNKPAEAIIRRYWR
ncbi:hypothetical protein FEF65_01615 [Mariprofundus erugo]|uniref:Glycosidase-like protein n=1 Tax=Mariprofundus erugo TaxID=2528639 RepID=A0A5R9GUQ5_9PROT|nr:hypothetical protein [Mariprofundus erugo]TLS69208.1 hypothetical protein FEF65_01615 [Mariprofundus erugo]